MVYYRRAKDRRQHTNEKIVLVEVLEGIEDSRRERSVRYPLHVVNAFSAELGLVLGQLAYKKKSNKITAIAGGMAVHL